MKRYSALELIGRTPLVALKAISPPGGVIWAKAEFQNPGGSVKDRTALAIIDAAYGTGALRKGQAVVEMTSGNMGAGLAVVCAVRGNPLVVTMSRGNSPERVRMLEALGAEVVLVDQVDGVPGQVTGSDVAAAADVARVLAAERGGYYVDQFQNAAGMVAHEFGTGPEITEALNGDVHAFVSTVGTGCTLMGVARHLRRCAPRARIVVVEPAGAEILAGKAISKPRHLLQGTGYGVVPHLWDTSLVDVFLSVSDEEALECRRRLAVREGLHVGFSAAANVCAAAKLIQSGTIRSDGHEINVVTILCDTGLKYSA